MKRKIDLGYIFRYYWFFIIGGLAFLAAVVGICLNILKKEPEPDYTVALMCGVEIDEADISALRAVFEGKADDLNADGRKWVQIDTYLFAGAENADDENDLDPYRSVANTVWFQAELLQGKSVLYLVRPYTYETLQKLQEDFFVPVKELLPAEENTVPLSRIVSGEKWQDFEIALHLPENRSAVEDSIELLKRLLDP